MKKHAVMKVAPYDSSRLWYTNENYTLNYMLLTQVDFPAEFTDKDHIMSVYSDRIYEVWNKAVDELQKKQKLQRDNWNAVSKKNLIFFANIIFEESLKYYKVKTVTGVRVIRCTNVSSGYPIIYIEAFVNNSGVATYSNDSVAPNILTRDKVFNYYGEPVYKNWSSGDNDGTNLLIFPDSFDSYSSRSPK